MTTEPSHDRCACGEDHGPDEPEPDTGEISATERAFFRAMVERIVGGVPSDGPVQPFMVGAIQGRVMREHVNVAHPSEVEHVAGIACPTNDTREGWLFGYRYEDSTPRGGDEQGTHSGDARGGGCNAAGADRDGAGAGPLYGISDDAVRRAKAFWFGEAAGMGFLYTRKLPDGRVIYLAPLGTGTRLGISRNDTVHVYDDVWDYPFDSKLCGPDAGWRAALGWDGEGEPEGWYRHPRSGRRRPGGDKAKEHVRP